MALIYAVSAQPTLPKAPSGLLDLLLKKAAHMGEYAILFLLLWQALRSRSVGLAGALSVLYAVSDEYHQTFVPGRNGWYGDVIVDSAGVLLTALVTWRAARQGR